MSVSYLHFPVCQVISLVSSGILIAIVANVWQTLSSRRSALSAVNLQLFAIALLAITVFCCNLMVNMTLFGPSARRISDKSSSRMKTPASVASNVTVTDSFLSPLVPCESADKVTQWLQAVGTQPRHEVVKKLFTESDAKPEPELAVVASASTETVPTSRSQSVEPPSVAPSPEEDSITTACRLVDSIPVDGRISPETLAFVTDAIRSNPSNAEVR